MKYVDHRRGQAKTSSHSSRNVIVRESKAVVLKVSVVKNEKLFVNRYDFQVLVYLGLDASDGIVLLDFKCIGIVPEVDVHLLTTCLSPFTTLANVFLVCLLVGAPFARLLPHDYELPYPRKRPIIDYIIIIHEISIFCVVVVVVVAPRASPSSVICRLLMICPSKPRGAAVL